jgi:hypothetical protein
LQLVKWCGFYNFLYIHLDTFQCIINMFTIAIIAPTPPAEVLEIADGLLKTATEYGGVGVVHWGWETRGWGHNAMGWYTKGEEIKS